MCPNHKVCVYLTTPAARWLTVHLVLPTWNISHGHFGFQKRLRVRQGNRARNGTTDMSPHANRNWTKSFERVRSVNLLYGGPSLAVLVRLFHRQFHWTEKLGNSKTVLKSAAGAGPGCKLVGQQGGLIVYFVRVSKYVHLQALICSILTSKNMLYTK